MYCSALIKLAISAPQVNLGKCELGGSLTSIIDIGYLDLMKNFYLTTAIDYANGSPHLGHAYEKILADVIATRRSGLSRAQETHFVTGSGRAWTKGAAGSGRRGYRPADNGATV